MSGFERLGEVVARLRGPDGCPWDRKQTLASLSPNLLEETHEVLSAIRSCDHQALGAELETSCSSSPLQPVFWRKTRASRSNRSRTHRRKDGPSASTCFRRSDHRTRLGRRKTEIDPVGSRLDGVPETLPALHRAQRSHKRRLRLVLTGPPSRACGPKWMRNSRNSMRFSMVSRAPI